MPSHKRTTDPTAYPVTTAEALEYLHVAADDAAAIETLARLIRVATNEAERITWRALITQTWTLKLADFPMSDELVLPRAPATGVTSISYVDTAGATQTLSATKYTVDTAADPGLVRLNYGESWPSVRYHGDAVTVVYTAGYGAGGSYVPEGIRQAMLMLVGHWFEQRNASTEAQVYEVPWATESLLIGHRAHGVIHG